MESIFSFFDFVLDSLVASPIFTMLVGSALFIGLVGLIALFFRKD